MQLSLTTDYAVRTVCYLTTAKEICNTATISRDLRIPPSYIQKVMTVLKKAGVVTAIEGTQGGYLLTRPANEIVLMDIINTSEKTMKINRCLEVDKYCSRNAVDICPVHKMYQVLQQEIENLFSQITIEAILDEKVTLQSLSEHRCNR